MSYDIIVGYRNYEQIKHLQTVLAGSDVNFLDLGSDMHGLNEAVERTVASQVRPIVIVDPAMPGWAADYVKFLLFFEAFPIPVIGLSSNDIANQRAAMLSQGAVDFIDLSTPEAASALMARFSNALRRVDEDRAAGSHHATPEIAPMGNGTVRSQCITVYLPKGGGSSRTTTVLNLASGLARLGHPTAVVDFDNTKGDVHTMLGYTVDATSLLTPNFTKIDRGIYDLMMNLLMDWDGKGSAPSIDPITIRRYMTAWTGHPSVGKNLHFLPGLLSPSAAGDKVWRQRQKDVHELARAILRTLKTLYTFVIVDISQDYLQPLVAAALDEADEVLLPIPPYRTALMAVQLGMHKINDTYGNYNKFRWFPTLWDDTVGAPSITTISKALKIPKLDCVIPDDYNVAALAINTCVPYILTDEGPLGVGMRRLVGNYDKRALDEARELSGAAGRRGLLSGIKRAMVKKRLSQPVHCANERT